MKDIILLTRILFKSSINNTKTKTYKKSFARILLFVFIYLYIAGIVVYISYQSINSLIQIKQEAVYLNICFVGILGLGVIQTIFSSLNVLFFSKDIEYLIPLPIKPIKIIMAKINCLIISQFIIELVVILPVIILYGYLLNLSISFYIMGLLVMLMFPIIPVVITTFIVNLILKFTNIIKNKDVVQYISVGLTLIFVILVQFLNTSNNEITNEELGNMLVEANGLIKIYSNIFITIEPTINSLLNYNNLNGIYNIAILFLETIVTYVIGSLIISKMYIKIVVSSMVSKTKKNKKLVNTKVFNKNSIIKSYVKKEFKNLNRNPIFFMQCILPSILFPFIFSIPVFMSFKDMNEQQINEIKSLIIENIGEPIGISICLSIIMFFFMINFIAITSVSRDRDTANFMKYIPIELEKQCLYKIIPGIILNIFPLIFFIIALICIIHIENIKIVLYICIGACLINVFNNYLMIIIDLKNPKLEWITEYAVVKQNINMFFQMGIILLEIGIVIFLGLKVTNLEIFILSINFIYIIGIYLIVKYISRNKIKLFEKVI